MPTWTFWLLSPHQPSLAVLATLVAVPLTWRPSAAPERACALSLGAIAMFDLLIWSLSAGSLWQHALADSIVLSWVVPVALRANRMSPAAIAAALLIAAACQWLRLLSLTPPGPTVDLVVGVAHVLAVCAYLVGWTHQQRLTHRSGSTPAWLDQLPPG
jgi:hypothetical protein